jgi:chromosome segregation ATPase
MARGGINKALVQRAREAVLAKGQNPSIDAIRVERGNTGSKTTIHRYLRELEEEAAARLDDQALLSEPIKELVGRLACRLREEAQVLVNEAKEREAAAARNWRQRYEETNGALCAAEQEIGRVKSDLEAANTENQEFRASQQIAATQLHEAGQAKNELQARIDEKDHHIASLEEKHTHARDALEHYRQSVKEQREQDIRRHEHQLQQL